MFPKYGPPVQSSLGPKKCPPFISARLTVVVLLTVVLSFTAMASARPSPSTSAKKVPLLPKNGPPVQSSGAPKEKPLDRLTVTVLLLTVAVLSLTSIASAWPSPSTSAKNVPRVPKNGPDVQSCSAPNELPFESMTVTVPESTSIASAFPSWFTSAKKIPIEPPRALPQASIVGPKLVQIDLLTDMSRTICIPNFGLNTLRVLTAIASALPSPSTSAKNVPAVPKNGPPVKSSGARKPEPLEFPNITLTLLEFTMIRSCFPSPFTSAK